MESLTSALSYLRSDWRERVLEDYEQERHELSSSRRKVLQKEARLAVWGMCQLLGVDTYGIPGRACRMLERYLYQHIHNFCRNASVIDELRTFKRVLLERMPLLMASCAQLSAKMGSASAKVTANFVRSRLASLQFYYTVQEINNSEFHVFGTLQFRVPMWTSVEVGQLLTLELGMPRVVLENLAVTVNAAELRLDIIERRLRAIAEVSPQSSNGEYSPGGRLSLLTLHLVAGALAACARYFAFDQPDPSSALAKMTRAPPELIRCVADIILTDILMHPTCRRDPPAPPLTHGKRRKLIHEHSL